MIIFCKTRLFRPLATSLLALLLGSCQPAPPPAFQSTDITGADFGRQFTLPDTSGRERHLNDFKGKVAILFFGYTSCPDICPTTLARFADTIKLLGTDAERTQVLFVSLDPERDSRERLASYVSFFNPRFLALVGDAARTEATAREFKIFYSRRAMDNGSYSIDHSAGAYVFDPQGRLRLFVKDEVSNEALASDLRRLLTDQ